MDPTPAVETLNPKSQKAKAPEYTPLTRLSVVYFRESVMFGSEMQSAAVGNMGSNCVDSILPAVMDPDGSMRIASEGEVSGGLGLFRKVHELHSNNKVLRQTFVPWANVKCVGYGK